MGVETPYCRVDISIPNFGVRVVGGGTLRGAGKLVHGVRPGTARVALAALVLVGAAGGCAPDEGQDARLPRPEPTTRSGPDLSDADLWLSFERTTVDYDGSTAYPDALGGPFAGRVVIE
jgi:hypothetical protein